METAFAAQKLLGFHIGISKISSPTQRAETEPSISRHRATRPLRCGARMKLPNASQALVEREKIVDYLLSPTHRYGASKAQFFRAFGFRIEEWEGLAVALRDHAQTYEVVRTRETGHGPRFEVAGELRCPDGRRPRVRTVWQLDKGEVAPRLITAYPLEEKQ